MSERPVPQRPRARRAPIGALLAAAGLGAACASGGAPDTTRPGEPPAEVSAILEGLEEPGWPPARPIPYPVVPPSEYRAAVEREPRSASGAPGPGYWQQRAEYRLFARLEPDQNRLRGRAVIGYVNESPDRLERIYLHLTQNVHAEGVVRNEPYEVTGGVHLDHLAVDGTELHAAAGPDAPGYTISGTILEVSLIEPLPPGEALEIEAHWWFDVPQQGAGARMGRSGDDLFFIAYWYPQVAVYDDVVGWHTDPFLGAAEFYTGFASYELTVEAPHGWVVRATGELENPEEVLTEPVRARLEAASASDTVVRILGTGDLGPGRATRRSSDGWLVWRFVAERARDAAFSATRASLWDAVRTPVGDRDGDGAPDHARVEALYRPAATLWSEVSRYGRHAIDFHSRYTAIPYPWPHMTAVEGGGIIGGGMEFPMMTLMGDYAARGDSALYFVTAHELAHMWVPMIVGTDERRYGWMDEGMTSFLENQARKEFFPGDPSDSLERESYLRIAGTAREGEMMRRTDYQYPGAGGVASYSKPATLLVALRGLLGEETFLRAYRTYLSEWAWRHPKPWDFFRTFERVAGRELGWFWRAWYYETWTLDQAVTDVRTADDGVHILIEDQGLAPMPVRLLVVRADGSEVRRVVPVERWLSGATTAEVVLPPGAPVVRVEIDPEGVFPDVDRTDNVWAR